MSDFVVGIDVGGKKKGFHLSLKFLETSEISSFFHCFEPTEVLDYLRQNEIVFGGKCLQIAINAPKKALVSETRLAEKAVRKSGYRVLWTPTKPENKQKWMENGELLWETLSNTFPVNTLIETFPTLTGDKMDLSKNILPIRLFAGKEKRKYINDFLDSALCMLAAEKKYKNEALAFGKDDPLGAIYSLKTSRKQLTLCIIHTDTKILLGYKKRGFGKGLLNGFGGKIEAGETPEEAVLREIREETNADVERVEKSGRIEFTFDYNNEELEGHIYKSTSLIGEPRETDEMIPNWYPLSAIPYDSMWIDDRLWLPILLSGKKFIAHFHFNDESTIVNHSISIVDKVR